MMIINFLLNTFYVPETPLRVLHVLIKKVFIMNNSNIYKRRKNDIMNLNVTTSQLQQLLAHG